MDQFPHDDGPRHKDAPFKPHKGSRLVSAHPAGPYVRLSLSPVIGERHTLNVQQAIALMWELAQAVELAEPCPASTDLRFSVKHAVEEWEVQND